MKKSLRRLMTAGLAVLALSPCSLFASYALTMSNCYSTLLQPSSSYFLNSGNASSSFCLSSNSYKNYTVLVVPESGTLTSVYGGFTVYKGGSSEACTVNVVQASPSFSSAFLVSNSFEISSDGFNAFSNNNMNMQVSAGDILKVELITPAWSTSPSDAGFTVSLYIQ